MREPLKRTETERTFSGGLAQVTVEYLLLLVVVVALFITVKRVLGPGINALQRRLQVRIENVMERNLHNFNAR